MTQDTLSRPIHPTEGELLRFGDGECRPHEHGLIERHVAECAECAESFRFFQAATAQLHDALEDIPIEPVIDAKQRFLAAALRIRPQPSGRRPFQRSALLRAAVIVFALIGVGVSASPVRAWILEFLGIAAEPAPVEEPSIQPVADVPGTQPTSSTVSFLPAGSTFRIEITGPQQSGTLTIRIGDRPTASVRVTGNTSGDSLLVTGDGFWIFNTPESSATYTVTVPPTISELSVQVGDAPVRTLSPEQIAAQDSVVLELSR